MIKQLVNVGTKKKTVSTIETLLVGANAPWFHMAGDKKSFVGYCCDPTSRLPGLHILSELSLTYSRLYQCFPGGFGQSSICFNSTFFFFVRDAVGQITE